MNPPSSIIALLALLLLQSSFYAAQGVYPTCYVCGEGVKMANPEAIYDGAICSDLEEQGMNGLFEADLCMYLPALLCTTCGC